jgi:hypothetical protein
VPIVRAYARRSRLSRLSFVPWAAADKQALCQCTSAEYAVHTNSNRLANTNPSSQSAERPRGPSAR